MKNITVAVLLFLVVVTPTLLKAQVSQPDTSLTALYNERFPENDTLGIDVQFEPGKFNPNTIREELDSIAEYIKEQIEQYPHLTIEIWGRNDGLSWVPSLKSAFIQAASGQADIALDFNVSDGRSSMSKWYLENAHGISGHRISRRAILDDTRRDILIVIKYEPTNEQLLQFIAKHIPQRGDIENLQDQLDELRSRLDDNDGVDRQQSRMLDDLDARITALEEEDEPSLIGLSLGASVSSSDYPNGIVGTESVVAELYGGLHMRRYLFFEITGGIGPHQQTTTLPDGESSVRTWLVRATGSLFPIKPIPVGIVGGYSIKQERAEAFDKYLSQKKSWLVGLEVRWNILRIQGLWSPGDVDYWRQQSIDSFTSSAVITVGLNFTLGG